VVVEQWGLSFESYISSFLFSNKLVDVEIESRNRWGKADLKLLLSPFLGGLHLSLWRAMWRRSNLFIERRRSQGFSHEESNKKITK
jgi:hypothetical protein